MMDNYGKQEKKRNEDKKKKELGKHRGESEWTSTEKKKQQEG